MNDIYTGEEIYSHYVYSSLYSYMLVALTFSAGMPLVIPFSAGFFFVFYLVYKILLLKYYAKATMFNKDLPIESTRVSFTAGVILHLFFGSLMLSNAQVFDSNSIKYKALKDSG